jgi:iron complex outermembrane receptor protein
MYNPENVIEKVRKYVIVLACLAQLPLPSLAQADEPGNSQAARELPALEEVLVTATRRVESLQDVAMSVSAFSEQSLQDSGVTRLAELDEYTPNLRITTATDSRSTSIRIRGIGSVGSNSGVDPSVGLFIDEVYQGQSGMSIGDLVDVRQVEVLRGPQGTLYGKNTSAGAISILTNTPVENFESMGEVTYDSNQQLELRGMVNVPFGNSGHALRLSGFGVEGDHLYKNDFTGDGLNDTNKWGGRARMLLDLQGSNRANDYGELLISVDYTKEDTDCCALAVMDYDGLSTLNSPSTNHPSAELQAALGLNAAGKPILAYTAFEDSSGVKPPKADPFGDHYWFNSDLGNKVEVGGATVQWNRQLAEYGALTFINAWRHYESDSAFDGDFTAYNAVEATTDVKLDQYSSELRLTSPGGETFDYLAGLYAYYSKFDSLGTFSQLPGLVNNVRILGDITLGDFFPDGSVNTDTNDYRTTSYAAFGQLVWNYSEKASATLGLRYTYEEKQRKGSQITNPTTVLDLPPIAGPDVFYDSSRNDSDLSPSLNLRYFFDPDIMTYGLVSRGFKSGGFNQRREVVGSNGEFNEEIATNYELGWKTSWGARRLQFNGTLFYVDYGDFQSQTFDGSSVRVTNAGNLESYGAELELLFAPTADLVVGTAVGYDKAQYGSFDNGQCTVDQAFYEYYVVQGAQTGSPGTSSNCTQDLKGKPLANAPEWNVSSYVQYDKDLGADLFMLLRLEYSYIDDYFLEEDLDPNLKNNAVDIVNLRLGLASQDRRWEVTLWGRNMLDEKYYVFGLDIPTLGGYAGVVGAGASYGITLRLTN